MTSQEQGARDWFIRAYNCDIREATNLAYQVRDGTLTTLPGWEFWWEHGHMEVRAA
jgi:hypothetical protein